MIAREIRAHVSSCPAPRRLLGHLGSTGAALLGGVVGHTLTYVVAIGDAHARHSLLAKTGHAQWHHLEHVLVALGVWIAVSTAVRHFRDGAHRRELGAEPFVQVAFRLATLQVTFFTCLEVGERLASGASLGTLATQGVFPLGLAVQILVAGGLAVLLRFVARAAEAIGKALGPRPAEVWPCRRMRPVPAIAFGRPAYVASAGPRGPPLQ